MSDTTASANATTSADPSTSASSDFNPLPLLLGGAAFQPYIYESAKYLLAGTLIELVRRIWMWVVSRFKMRYSVSAEFTEGDPAYEWIINMLTEDGIWKKSRNFSVTSKTSQRRWGVDLGSLSTSNHTRTSDSKEHDSPRKKREAHADYVPSYNEPHLFKWRGHWCDVRKGGEGGGGDGLLGGMLDRAPAIGTGMSSALSLTIFSLDLSLLDALVEEARDRYLDTTTNYVSIYSTDMAQYNPTAPWTNPKRKHQRPLDSLVLEPGIIDALIADAKEFFSMEQWYRDAGIPHHRGYLLHGPPGTGKTSTIYALAGELSLEIYTISLASNSIDDFYLQRLVNAIPKNSILLIEDIDCAFPDRDEEEDEELDYMAGMPRRPQALRRPRSAVTMSGLLNVIDGVGSEEGKLFFATTNYVDRLDAAMMRPGRIDRKFEYNLATTYQASALFDRFFPASRFPALAERLIDSAVLSVEEKAVSVLAKEFGESIPAATFTTAELQGFLLLHKMDPLAAVAGAQEWAAKEIQEKKEKKDKEDAKRKKWETAREAAKAKMGYDGFGGFGMGPATPNSRVVPLNDSEEKEEEEKEEKAPATPVSDTPALKEATVEGENEVTISVEEPSKAEKSVNGD